MTSERRNLPAKHRKKSRPTMLSQGRRMLFLVSSAAPRTFSCSELSSWKWQALHSQLEPMRGLREAPAASEGLLYE